MKYYLPELKYSYDALEPYIDETTMKIHHTKHHQTYVNKLNAALEKHPELKEYELSEMLKLIDKVPADIKTAIKNNGGGHYNHTLFWSILGPNKNQNLCLELEKAIKDKFGSFVEFRELFTEKAKTHFGSGWVWLIAKEDKSLEIVTTANQDTPLKQGTPILTIDVWEHAYYLNYQNRRPDYIEAFWNVVNWEQVNKLYQNL